MAITGASGLIGRGLAQALAESKHEVIRIVRSKEMLGSSTCFWDLDEGVIETEKLTGVDAVVHLGARSLLDWPWTGKKKVEFRESRTRGTRNIATALAAMSKPPAVLISASAVGYYGDRGEEVLDEDSLPGEGFLADLAVDWESATGPAVDAGIRVVHLRTGLVLTKSGGILSLLGPLFKVGLGGRVGNGLQWMSWITLADEVKGIIFALQKEEIEGPLNLCTPNPVRNKKFTLAMAQALRRPAILKVPAVLARRILGEMAQETVLQSVRVQPKRLTDAGYVFEHPDLQAALRKVFTG